MMYLLDTLTLLNKRCESQKIMSFANAQKDMFAAVLLDQHIADLHLVSNCNTLRQVFNSDNELFHHYDIESRFNFAMLEAFDLICEQFHIDIELDVANKSLSDLRDTDIPA